MQIQNVRKKVKKSLNILSYKRPAGSKTEESMIRKFIDVLPNAYSDAFGNRIVRVGSDNTTMFSCHTDTVHHTEGMQTPYYDQSRGEMFVNHKECLGADDGAGIVCMIAMIQAQVNGLYVFHREEEVGGNGSNYIVKNTPELVEGIDRCIAFDRRGTDNIITHQGMERCCSDEFAEEFAQELMKSNRNLCFFPDNTGSFTDSANYTEIIPECTNLSCGYESEHTSSETLDVLFLQRLIDSLIQVNFDNLCTTRDPSVIDYDWDYDYTSGYTRRNDYLPANESFNGAVRENDNGTVSYNISLMSNADVVDFVYDYPEYAAEVIQEYRDHLADAYRYAI
jgi:hypothetical protein